MTIDTSAEDSFRKAIRDVALTNDTLMRACVIALDETDDRACGWEARRARLLEMSRLARVICDSLSVAEDIVKREAPPECDIRVRPEPVAGRCKVGLIEGMTADEKGWLSLAAKDGHVLEIKILDGEWTSEAFERFNRACTTSPAECLVAALAEKTTA